MLLAYHNVTGSRRLQAVGRAWDPDGTNSGPLNSATMRIAEEVTLELRLRT